jgi:hypothetical protein
MGEQTFRVKRLPDPTPYLVENEKQLPDDKVIRKTLNKNTTLEIGYGADGILNVPFEITSFETNILRKQSKSKGNKFSQDQLKQIAALKSGDNILFMNIRYRVKGGEETKYPRNYSILLK